jgi:hypothetical protein
VARAARIDDGEPASGGRYITDLERLEEYSASHAETFDQLGEWNADRFEAAWEAYQIRKSLDIVNEWERGMKEALYANGMIDGKGLSSEITSITEHAEALRAKLLGADLGIEEEQLSEEAPYPVTAEADPDAA